MAGNEYLTGYQPCDTDAEDEQAPIFGHIAEHSPTEQWNHIDNLDDFFTRIYHYHQRHGFMCMVVEDFLQLVQFLLIVVFTGFLVDCVDYDILFATRTPSTKQTFSDVVICPCKFGFSTPAVGICVTIAYAFLCTRTLMVLFNSFKYWEIRQFYRIALEISSSELDNKTWSEVLTRLMEVQKDIQMCIYKNELTQLDIYHRILRYKNYFISMINKSVIPLKLKLPFIGEFCYLSQGLRVNLDWLLFWTPACFNISPFQSPYVIKKEYKNVHRRIQLAKQLSNRILIVSLANLLLSPVIFLWQILYFFFVYGNIVKREPGFLGSRKWSSYARAYLRHFNELDHELDSRLSQAYSFSNEYMSGFISPLMSIFGKFLSFIGGAVLVMLVSLTVYDEDTLQIEHMLTVMTACGMLITIGAVFTPPENLVFVPETKMTQILAHVHYQPNHWKDKAHTTHVRDEFGQLFQFKAISLAEELLSPLMTPLILIFLIRPKSQMIVDFYRNFTVDVAGVGDICSFAQLDIRKHGNRKWSATGAATADEYLQAEHGKTELSLMHFSLTNPTWKPPEEASQYMASIRENAARDADEGLGSGANPLTNSLIAFSQVKPSTGRSRFGLSGSSSASVMNRSAAMYGSMSGKQVVGSISKHTGPLTDEPLSGGILDAVNRSGSFEGFASDIYSSEYTSHEMSVSVLYMHELKRRNRLSNIGHVGYDNLETIRQVMTDSDLHPVPEFPDIDEELGSTSSSPTQSMTEHV